VIYEKCPLCDAKLEVITNEEGYVIDYWCSSCGTAFTIEDLEIIEVKEVTMDRWLK